MEQLQGSGNGLARGGYSRGKQVVREKWRIFACMLAGECKFKHIARQRWGIRAPGAALLARLPGCQVSCIYIVCCIFQIVSAFKC